MDAAKPALPMRGQPAKPRKPFDIARLRPGIEAPDLVLFSYVCGHCLVVHHFAVDYKEVDQHHCHGASPYGWRWAATPDQDGDVDLNNGARAVDLCPNCAEAFEGDGVWFIKDWPSKEWVQKLSQPVPRPSELWQPVSQATANELQAMFDTDQLFAAWVRWCHPEGVKTLPEVMSITGETSQGRCSRQTLRVWQTVSHIANRRFSTGLAFADEVRITLKPILDPLFLEQFTQGGVQ